MLVLSWVSRAKNLPGLQNPEGDEASPFVGAHEPREPAKALYQA